MRAAEAAQASLLGVAPASRSAPLFLLSYATDMPEYSLLLQTYAIASGGEVVHTLRDLARHLSTCYGQSSTLLFLPTASLQGFVPGAPARIVRALACISTFPGW